MNVQSGDFRDIAYLVDELWAHLKMWVRQRGDLDEPPNDDECATEIMRIVRDVMGHENALPPQALDFYASEATTMLWEQWSKKRPSSRA